MPDCQEAHQKSIPSVVDCSGHLTAAPVMASSAESQNLQPSQRFVYMNKERKDDVSQSNSQRLHRIKQPNQEEEYEKQTFRHCRVTPLLLSFKLDIGTFRQPQESQAANLPYL